MNLAPSEKLTESQVKSGLKLLVRDGLFAEAMTTLTSGAFLIALALKLGASNFQIGLLASLPTLANVFQIVAIYLLFRIANRRAIAVYSALFARIPLLLVSFLPMLFSFKTDLNLLILILFFHYLFSAISGCSWTSWTKDLVPEEQLGTYFSHRTRVIQILNVVLSLACAVLVDNIKSHFPKLEIPTYSVMFFIAGVCGILGAITLSRIAEPKLEPIKNNFLSLFKNPLRNKNFRNLLIFNSWWVFAINLAAPFFSVYMLKMLQFPLSYVVGFNILSQITNILFIRLWGRYSDKYSNKTILRICAPIYLACILAWTFTTMPHVHPFTLPLVIIIAIFSGIALAGINLALSNIGLKLAPKQADAIIYLTARGISNAFFAGIAPIIGGLFADYFSTRELSWNIEWKGPSTSWSFPTIDLHSWDFFFVLAFILGIIALYRLSFVKEKGEVRKGIVMREIAEEVKNTPAYTGVRGLVSLPFVFFRAVAKKKRAVVGKNREALKSTFIITKPVKHQNY